MNLGFNDYNYTIVRDTYGTDYKPKELVDPTDISRLINDYLIIKLITNTDYTNPTVFDTIYLDSSVLCVKYKDKTEKELYDLSIVLPKNHMIYQVGAKIIPSNNYIEVYIPIYSLTQVKNLI
jgi:hypothetical protein